MSTPMTDISTPTTNPTNLYTTKATNFNVYDGKKITETSRPSESKVPDGEKPEYALDPSLFTILDMATESCIKKSLKITHDEKYKYITEFSFFDTPDATQFYKNILKYDSSYEIILTSLFVEESSLKDKKKDNIVIDFDGDKYIEIKPTSELKTHADKALNDAIERNDGDNRGTASDTDEMLKIMFSGVKGKFIFCITYSSLIRPSLSPDDNKDEEFVIGVSFLNTPGQKTDVQIIQDNTTFKDNSSKNLGDLLAHFPHTTYLSISSQTLEITNVGINHVMAIMKRPKQKPSVSFADNATLTFPGKGAIAILDIDLNKITKPTCENLTCKKPNKFKFKMYNDNSGSMGPNVGARNNTNIGLTNELFGKFKDLIASGSIDKDTEITLSNIAFDDKVIPEWSITETIKFDSDNIHQKLEDTKKIINDTIMKQSASGSTNFLPCFESPESSDSCEAILFLTDGNHNCSSEEKLLEKIKTYCKSVKYLYIALLGIGPYAYMPLLHKMAQVVRNNGHTCDVFSSTLFPGSDNIDSEINTSYKKIANKFVSNIFEQTSYNIVLPKGCQILHGNMNNHTIDGNKISFKASGGNIKLIISTSYTDKFEITANDTKMECDVVKQANPFPTRNYIGGLEFYTDTNKDDNDSSIKLVNEWIRANNLTSCRVSSVYKWLQDFGGTVAVKEEPTIPKQNTTSIVNNNTIQIDSSALKTLTEDVEDLKEELEDNTCGPARGVVTRGITRGATQSVTRSVTRGNTRSVARGVTRGVTRGAMKAVFTHSEPNKKIISFIKPIDILKIQDINNFLNLNNTCYGEWFWHHIIMNPIDIMTYNMLKMSHNVITMIIDSDNKFKSLMSFKHHILNTIKSLASILESLKKTKEDNDTFTSYPYSANIISNYSSVIDNIILDVAKLKHHFAEYQNDITTLSTNEHIKAANNDTYLFQFFAVQTNNVKLFDSLDKDILTLSSMKASIVQLFQ